MLAMDEYEVVAIDLLANSPDAFSILAPFSRAFSGQGQDMKIAATTGVYDDVPHRTGYENTAYNELIQQAFDTKFDTAKRAQLLHDAEALLMEDMPVIPIIFNQQATLTSPDLSKMSTSYFGFDIFTKVKQKNYLDYIVTAAEEEEETPE